MASAQACQGIVVEGRCVGVPVVAPPFSTRTSQSCHRRQSGPRRWGKLVDAWVSVVARRPTLRPDGCRGGLVRRSRASMRSGRPERVLVSVNFNVGRLATDDDPGATSYPSTSAGLMSGGGTTATFELRKGGATHRYAHHNRLLPTIPWQACATH